MQTNSTPQFISKSSSLKDRIAQRDIAARIAAKLASGKFTDTGATYTPEQAVADASNSDLRMTATIASDNTLTWSK